MFDYRRLMGKFLNRLKLLFKGITDDRIRIEGCIIIVARTYPPDESDFNTPHHRK